MIFKLIHFIKEHWWSLSLSWPDEVQRMIFDRPFVLRIKYKNHKQFS